MEKFFQEPKIDMLCVRLNLPDSITPTSEKLYQQISDLSRANDKRVFILTRATEPPAPVWYDKLNSLDLTFTGDYRKSIRAMSRLRKNERDRAIGRFAPAARSGVVPGHAHLGQGILSYGATDKLLRAYGIPLAPGVVTQSAAEAGNAAETHDQRRAKLFVA